MCQNLSTPKNPKPVQEGSTYRKTPNKRPWAFAGSVALERTFSPSRSNLRNENRTIFSRDIAKNVRKHPTWALGCREGRLLEGGVYWGFYGKYVPSEFPLTLYLSCIVCRLRLLRVLLKDWIKSRLTWIMRIRDLNILIRNRTIHLRITMTVNNFAHEIYVDRENRMCLGYLLYEYRAGNFIKSSKLLWF